MKFQIPFTVSSLDKLKKRSLIFKRFVRPRTKSFLQECLKNTETGLGESEYRMITVRSFFLFFGYLLPAIFLVLLITNLVSGILTKLILSLVLSLAFSMVIFSSQSVYPRVYINRKERAIERNLIPALEDMLIQLNSGVPLFSILSNIALSDYDELSEEFKKAVKKINAGIPEIFVLEEMGDRNPSLYFRRAIWQISNGMRAGSDISIVIKDSIKSLGEEQIIQIQTYGNKLNPMIMFYMLISVIMPALSVTFLTIISSMIGLSGTITMMMFGGIFILVLLVQITFLGLIKSARPSLL